jgi:hypothetical protein
MYGAYNASLNTIILVPSAEIGKDDTFLEKFTVAHCSNSTTAQLHYIFGRVANSR